MQLQATGFDGLVLPHLGAAYNLARWLVRNDDDARDVVQEAMLRAWRSFDQFRGATPGDARAWLLAIVRNAAHTSARGDMSRRRLIASDTPFDEAVHATDFVEPPEAAALRAASASLVHAALEQLPIELREVIVLRELEGLSYKEIASVIDVPIGTVMSRLSRARHAMFDVLAPRAAAEGLTP